MSTQKIEKETKEKAPAKKQTEAKPKAQKTKRNNISGNRGNTPLAG